jgi:hypothetical protein
MQNNGSNWGIIELSNNFAEVLDCVTLLHQSGAWTDDDEAAFQSWLVALSAWLESDPLAALEATAPNNHQTWFDVLAVAIALRVGNTTRAAQVRRRVVRVRERVCWGVGRGGGGGGTCCHHRCRAGDHRFPMQALPGLPSMPPPHPQTGHGGPPPLPRY